MKCFLCPGTDDVKAFNNKTLRKYRDISGESNIKE